MKKHFILSLIFALFLGLFLNSKAQDYPQRKIVVFNEGVSDLEKNNLIKSLGKEKIKSLRLINASVVYLSKNDERVLIKSGKISRIDPDVEVYALEEINQNYNLFRGQNKAKSQPSETLTWNIDRIDAELSWNISTGDPIKVAVVDTGIDLKHPDLKNNIKGGYNAINPLKSANDDNGHGTHVAGIVAAIDNDIGVIGVGPNIDLYAVKVLGANGSGYLSDIIEGLDWVVNQKNNQGGKWVVNMSLGTSQDIQSFHDAVVRVYNAGIVQVAAAGNSGGSVSYPAAYEEVIAVSATDQNNQIASWSSRGPEVDFAAPGVDIYSTYKGSSYATLSGTSMSAPHVTGIVALVLNTNVCDFDNNGVCTPDETKTRIINTAIDLGDSGKDNLYGYGLINVYNALTQ